MNKEKISQKSWFKYVVILAILFIPFLYAFFYLKAYWDPYGKGNMDNIPVAIVNEDLGDKGKSLTEKLIDSKTLKFSDVNKENAEKGLDNKTYYAVITIPEDFTENLESASKEKKTPATITYSPNQKTNYLASQIINRVLLTVEKEVRSEVSQTVVENLSDKLKEVPKKMNQIEEGAQKLEDGANTLNDGLNTLNQKYSEFDNGISKLNEGSNSLTSGLSKVNNGVSTLQTGASSLNSGVKQINDALAKSNTDNLVTLTNGISKLNSGATALNTNLSNYVLGTESLASGLNTLNTSLSNMSAYYQSLYSSAVASGNAEDAVKYGSALETINQIMSNSGYQSLLYGSNQILDISTYGVTSGTALKSGMSSLVSGTETLNNSTSQIQSIGTSITSLKENLAKVQSGTESLESGVNDLKNGSTQVLDGSESLTNGLSTLKYSSTEVQNGIRTLSEGSTELTDGINKLKTSVKDGTTNTKSELKKLDGLSEFTANPVNVKEEDVNEVSSYGTAFAPFFMSIALWVGALMSFIILYYDANDRFKIFSRNAENKLKRTCSYLVLAALQGIFLGVLLMIGLDLNITNYFLYFISLIIVACLFESIMEILIVNLNDVGKFVALILLVLQLAAAGGTFPIQTVTKGFRWLHNLLPMKYTCDLFKESVITIEGTLLSNSMFVIVIVFLALTSFNIYKSKRED